MSLLKLISIKSLALASCAVIVTLPTTVHAQAEQKVSFDIKAQDLGNALTEFGMQSRKEIYFTEAEVRGKKTKGISGRFTPEDAIRRLLASTGVAYRVDENGTFLVGKRYIDRSQVASPQNQTGRDESAIIVVTGTNIRGADTGASPVIEFDRDDLQESGVATVQDFFSRLPQNFGGGANEAVFQSPDPQSELNRSAGSSINLRGLGSDATLVLLNGHRIAPSGLTGSFVDISMIPFSGIERVEILTDGASAIYGSDAIAGVVNLITSQNVDGGEVFARFGTSTEGNFDEFSAGFVAGESWQSGSVVASYEFYDRDNLSSNDRRFNDGAPLDLDLLPQNRRHNFLISGKQDVGAAVTLYADFLYGQRDSEQRRETQRRTSDVEQLGASLRGTADISESWQVELGTSYSRNGTNADAILLNNDFDPGFLTVSEILTADLKADGELFPLPGGSVLAAFGASYRREGFKNINKDPTDSSTVIAQLDGDRDIFAIFGEVRIPVVGAKNSFPGMQALEIIAAVRHEKYSDFGSSTNPKIGIVWEPFSDFRIRGSYSTSFKAPSLSDLAPSGFATLLNLPDPASPTGTTLSLLTGGSNPDLGAENSTSWTAGFDWTPAFADGLKFEANYFNINFTDRIQMASSLPFFGLRDAEAFAPVITRNPDEATTEKFILAAQARGQFFNVGRPDFTPLIPVVFADIDAIFDNRIRNIASSRVSGLDFAVTYAWKGESTDVNLFFNGNYLIEQKSQVTATSVSVDRVDKVFFPVDLRIRGGVSLDRGPFSIATFINYTDGYTNNIVTPEERVSSWTTFDTQIAYEIPENSERGILNGTRISLSITNIFNEDPPFINAGGASGATFSPFGFDAANASPVGRFVSVQLNKKW